MKLTLLTAVCGAVEITEQWFRETVASCVTIPEVVVVANGCTDKEINRLHQLHHDYLLSGAIIENDLPMGSTRAFNLGLKVATGDVVAMLHNDLMVREEGWDRRLLMLMGGQLHIGVVGFHGSKMLGDPAIYQRPYELTQLGRGESLSNLEDAEAHGGRTNLVGEVVTLDGMALCARRLDLLQWGGLDERYVHHMYDHDLCLTARQAGRRNYLLPIRARHISGQTANGSRYQQALGPDVNAHRHSHQAFYEKWRGTGMLPARLP